MKITNDDVLELNETCRNLVISSKLKFKHLYACNRTISFTKDVAEDVKKQLGQSEEYAKYIQDCIAVINEFAEKDKSEKIVLDPLKQPIFKTKAKEAQANKKIAELKEKYANAITQHEEKLDHYDEILSKMSEVQVYVLQQESEISNLSLADLTKTRLMYNIEAKPTIQRKLTKEDILSMFISAKSETALQDMEIKKQIVENLIRLETFLKQILDDERYENIHLVYDRGLEKIKHKHAKKDIMGSPVIVKTQTEKGLVDEYIFEDRNAFKKEYDDFMRENKKYIDDYSAMMKEEVEVSVSMLSADQLKIITDMEEVSQTIYLVINPLIE